MKKIIKIATVFGLLSCSNFVAAEEQLVTISHESEETMHRAFIWLHSNLHSGTPEESFQVYINETQRDLLLAKGFTLSEVISQNNSVVTTLSATSGIEGFACYETLAESKQIVLDLAEDYSDLVDIVHIGDSERKVHTGAGHPLEVIKLTRKNGVENKPILFMHAAMHAREYATAPVTLAFAQHMLEGYGVDPDITWILEQHEIHILLFMNPDGREKAEMGLSWRKNTNDAYCTEDAELHGADLNRNFTYSWSKNSQGSSTDECEITYRGPEPSSEPETQAVENYLKSIFADRRGPNDSDQAPDDVAGMHLDVHSYGELVLWPWGHTENAAPNGVQLERIARKVAYFNDYRPTQAYGLYPTTGSSESISYGELGIPQLTIELGTDFFQDCDTYEDAIKQQNIAAFTYGARIVAAPYQFAMGADVTGITVNGDVARSLSTDQTVSVVFQASGEQLKQDDSSPLDIDVSAIRFAIDEMPYADQAVVHSTQFLGSADSGDARAWGQFDTTGLLPGQHQLFAQAQNSEGHWGPIYSQFIEVLDGSSIGSAPIVDFDMVCSGLVCNFDGAKSFDLEDDIVEMKWLLSLGQYEEFGETAQYTFRNAGEFPIELVVTDAKGNRSSLKKTAVVTDNVADPQLSLNTVCQELICEMTADAVNGENLSFNWLIEQTNYADLTSVAHEFSSEGFYEVTLNATDGFGRNVVISQVIEVVLSESLDFAPNIQCSPNLCEFNVSEIDERITASHWQIDQTAYETTNVVSVDVSDDNIEWLLTGETEFGHVKSSSGVLDLSDLKNNFGVILTSTCNDLHCDFALSGLPSMFSSVEWQWANGETSTGIQTSYVFNAEGAHEFTIILRGSEVSYQIEEAIEVSQNNNGNDSSGESTTSSESESGGALNSFILLLMSGLLFSRRYIRIPRASTI